MKLTTSKTDVRDLAVSMMVGDRGGWCEDTGGWKEEGGVKRQEGGERTVV